MRLFPKTVLYLTFKNSIFSKYQFPCKLSVVANGYEQKICTFIYRSICLDC